MPIEAIETGIRLGPDKPAAIDTLIWVENPVRLPEPVDILRGLLPEIFRIPLPRAINVEIAALHMHLPLHEPSLIKAI
jgi:hypothetical protein